jgi:tetratricopeptide (TPR) repeat protein
MSTAHVTKLKRKAADLEQKKQLDKALELYIQLVDSAGRDLDDADLQIYNRVGDLLMRQANVSEALAYYEKAVDLYAERGYLNNAIALCNKILRQSPARTTVYYKLGKISANKGFKSDARKNFLEYADRMQKAGDTEEAFRALKEFADLCPDQDDIRLLLADLLSKEQRTDEAVEQLGQLYSKLESEGREAEARATMDRIKAINPDVTPPPSGSYMSQKSSDLVFLDLDEPQQPSARVTPPTTRTPVAPIPTVAVTGVGALEGLAVTFFPDEAPEAAEAAGTAPVDGLEVNTLSSDEEVAPLPHLELVGTDPGTPTEPLEGIEFDRPDGDEAADADIVTPVEGLASIGSVVTGTHPALAPLLDEPPMTGEEFGALDLTVAERESAPRVHDLALPSSLPMYGDEAPQSEEGATEPVAEVDAAASLEAAVAEAPASQVSKIEGAESLVSDTDAIVEEDPVAAQLEALDADDVDPGAIDDMPLPPARAEIPRPPAISPSELAAIRMAHLSDPDAPIERAQLSPEFALEEHGGRDEALPKSALDTSTLAGGLSLRGLGAPAPAHDAPGADDEEDEPAPISLAEDRVELPLLELESQIGQTQDSDIDELDDAAIDSLLSTPPSFASTEDPGSFDPAPLDFEDPASTDEWEAQHPEVLIDGEWHDERVGDLVSGDRLAVDAPGAPPSGDRSAAFDDLAAAMMYDGGSGARDAAAPPPGPSPDGDQGSRRTTVTFGGTEAQLRRRLETDPENPALRRQLGEALLDEGRREQGMHELELSVKAYEGMGAFGSAREVVDVILRVAPLSVQHHQKRVEYAVRANDRAQLIGAYTDLADALFRCGEPDKSRVVYSRVLDLDASNDRARFALGILSDEAVPGAGDVPAPKDANRPVPGKHTAGGADRLVLDNELPTLAHLGVPSDADARRPEAVSRDTIDPSRLSDKPVAVVDSALDEEVDAAFAEAHSAPVPPDEDPVADLPISGAWGAHGTMSEISTPDTDQEDDSPSARVVDAPKADERAPSLHRDEVALPTSRGNERAPQARDVAASRARDTISASKGDQTTQSPAQEFVDLGDWLRASEPTRSTRMVADDVVPSGDENADFAEMLRRFKQGVAANVEEEDFDSHYDLGVAFKEMGLIDDAIAEFQKALRGDDHRVRAYEALGQCFVEQGQFQVASTLLRRALETTQADDQRLVGVLYLLGFSSESMGRHGDAVGYYQRVFAVDIEFRDVSSRLAALDRKTQ